MGNYWTESAFWMESNLYLIVFVCAIILVAAYRFFGAKNSRSDRPFKITSEQLRCHGVWLGDLQGQPFYFCIYEIGQYIEGVYFQDGQQTQFTGTYLAPVLTFEKANEDGSNMVFTGNVNTDGDGIVGSISDYLERTWTAKLLSQPAQTKGLHLDVLSKLTATYLPPENLELRAKVLSNPDGLSIEDLSQLGHAAVRVWKVPPELQGQSAKSPVLVVDADSTPIPPSASGSAPTEADAHAHLHAPTSVSATGTAPTADSAPIPDATHESAHGAAPTSGPSPGPLPVLMSAQPAKAQDVDLQEKHSEALAFNPAKVDIRHCSECKSPLDAAFNFCLHCGKSVS